MSHVWIIFTFTFNHLADAFIQSDVQMRRTIEAIRPSREQQYICKSHTSVSFHYLKLILFIILIIFAENSMRKCI